MHKEEAGVLFKALGDSSRVKIIKMLYNKGEICACKLLELVDCGQPTLSHHLKVLSENNLIIGRKDGKWIKYSCNKQLVDELMKFISTPCKCCEKEV